MPWFPEFVSAVELARRQTRAAGQADPVGRYQAALAAGDAEAVVRSFEPGGYYREPIGPAFARCGAGELGSFFTRYFSGAAASACSTVP